jgi:glycerol-3-phosphate cytidylyltransferase
LIVGVSTDELVVDYKGKPPVIPFADRVKIVEAIRYVDEVVPQTSMDKVEAWKRLHFDAVFHGDDWKGSAMYNEIERSLSQVGCDLIFLPYTEGISSTALAKRRLE